MGDRQSSASQLDPSAIEWPLDRLSFKQIREIDPKFDRFEHRIGDGILDRLQASFGVESDFAKNTFKAVLGQSVDWGPSSPAEHRSMLADDYAYWGLAEGPHGAEELVRRLERDVVAQAERVAGRGK